jgi:hypothetical protein
MRQVTIYSTWYQPIYTESCMTILAVNGLRRRRRKFGRTLRETFHKVVTVPWYTAASIGYTIRWWRAMQESGSPLTLPFATGPATAFAFRARQRINSRLAFEDESQDIETEGSLHDGRTAYFISMACAAATFRFAWGPERSSPKHSTQSLPAATPQVGQGTARMSCDSRRGTNGVFFIQRG